MLRSVAIIGYYIGLVGMLFGLLLSIRPLRDAITNAWIYAQGRLESGDSARKVALRSTYRLLLAIYEKDGRIAYRRVLLFAFSLNALFYYPFLTIVKQRLDHHVALIALFLALIGVFVGLFTFLYELASVKMTLYFYRKALEKEKTRYIALDVLILIVVLYMAPLLILLVAGGNDYSIVLALTSPAVPLLSPLLFREHFEMHMFAFTIPAGLSVCLPTSIGVFFLWTFNSKHVMANCALLIEKISIVDGRWALGASTALLGVASAVYTFES